MSRPRRPKTLQERLEKYRVRLTPAQAQAVRSAAEKIASSFPAIEIEVSYDDEPTDLEE